MITLLFVQTLKLTKKYSLISFFIFYFWVAIFVPIVSYFLFTRKIRSYDGTEESLEKVSKIAKLYTLISMFVPISLNVIFVFWNELSHIIPLDGGRGMAMALCCIGSTTLLALIFYILSLIFATLIP